MSRVRVRVRAEGKQSENPPEADGKLPHKSLANLAKDDMYDSRSYMC